MKNSIMIETIMGDENESIEKKEGYWISPIIWVGLRINNAKELNYVGHCKKGEGICGFDFSGIDFLIMHNAKFTDDSCDEGNWCLNISCPLNETSYGSFKKHWGINWLNKEMWENWLGFVKNFKLPCLIDEHSPENKPSSEGFEGQASGCEKAEKPGDEGS